MPRRTLPGYWWAGLGTIPVLFWDETTPFSRNQLQGRANCLTARRACAREASHHDSLGALPGVGWITPALAGGARVIPVLLRDAVLGSGSLLRNHRLFFERVEIMVLAYVLVFTSDTQPSFRQQ